MTETGDYEGQLKARQDWRLSPDGHRMETVFRNDVYDVNGNVVQVIRGTAQATRIQVQRLPE